jgi:putative transposase
MQPSGLSPGEAFAWLDRRIDEGRSGPKFLVQPEIAEIVSGSIHIGVQLSHYDLHAWVIMPNHVHLLITPRIAPSRLLQSLKGATSRECNRLLGRTGEPFWQKESYDHWVRSDQELERIQRYIEWNPVKAGLVSKMEDWRWSSGSGKPACV